MYPADLIAVTNEATALEHALIAWRRTQRVQCHASATYQTYDHRDVVDAFHNDAIAHITAEVSQ